MFYEVFICETCGLPHRPDYDGIYCRNPDCGGRLINIRIVLPARKNGEYPELPPDVTNDNS